MTLLRTATRDARRQSVAVGRVLLLASVAMQPVWPGLHVAFSSHAHRFCAEHQRIEDIAGGPAPADAEQRPGFGPLPAAHPSPCGLLNAISPPTVVRRDDTNASRRPAADTSLPPPHLRARSRLILLLAPKTSPPATA